MNGNRERQFRRPLALLLTTLFLWVAGMERSQAAPAPAAPLVEITEVKNIGLSANSDAKSILQMVWSVNPQPGLLIRSFELSLDLTYADGAVERVKSQASGAERRARFEVPTLHRSAGRPGAELRSYKADITASYTETVTREGKF